MKKQFVSNIFFLLLMNFLVKPFYILGIDAEIQNRVGTEIYGTYFSLLNFSFLLTIFLDIGIVNYNTSHIAKYPKLVSKYVSKIIVIRILLAFIYAFISLILGIFIGYSGNQVSLLLLLILNQIIVGFTLYFRSNIAGLMLFKTDSIISILDRSLLIVICSILLWGGITNSPFQIEWFIYAQTVAYLITLIVSLIIVLNKAGKIRFHWDFVFYQAILKKSIPYATLILLMTIYYRADSVMIERLLPDGQQQAGYYAMGYRFFEASNNISYLFAALLLPMFSSLIKKKESVNELTILTSKILFIGVFTLAFLCIVFAKEIIELRYHTSENQAIVSFQLLMLCFACISSTYIFGTLLTAGEHLYTLNIIALSGMMLNIVLNLLFIPKYGAIGGAMASLITQLLTTVVQIYYSIKNYHLSFSISYLMKLLSFCIIMIATYFICVQMPLNWTIQILIIGTLSMIYVFALNLFSLHEVIKILKKA